MAHPELSTTTQYHRTQTDLGLALVSSIQVYKVNPSDVMHGISISLYFFAYTEKGQDQVSALRTGIQS